MSDTIDPQWLEACGFKKTGGHILTDVQWELFQVEPQVTTRGLVLSFRTSGIPRLSLCFGHEVIPVRDPTRSIVRSAWHALTGTRLVEPMPEDIVESTLILADKYEDDGFGDQAAYIRSLVSENERLKREIDEWHFDSATASSLDTEVTAVTSQLPRPRFANDSYRFRYCEQCRGCTQHMFLSSYLTPSFYECNSCRKSGYVAPVDATRRVPMIKSSAGLRPSLDGERVDGFALARDLEDALNNGTAFSGELIPARGEHQPNAYS